MIITPLQPDLEISSAMLPVIAAFFFRSSRRVSPGFWVAPAVITTT